MKKTEKEIELQMEKAIEKIPFELKKIKFILFLLKSWRNIKSKLMLSKRV